MSTLAQELDRYLAIRRSLGYDLGTAARVLRKFIAFADGRKARHITTELFLAWQAEFGQANQQTWSARLGMVRQFALWLSGINPRNEVPPKGLVPRRYRRSSPYIYTETEIEQIVGEAARLPSVNRNPGSLLRRSSASLQSRACVSARPLHSTTAMPIWKKAFCRFAEVKQARGSFRYHRVSLINSPAMPRSAIGFWAARRHRYSFSHGQSS